MGFFRQALFLLKLFIRLKSWRFLYCAFPIACLVSNTYIYPAIEGAFSQSSETYLGLTSYGAEEFAKASRVVVSTEARSQQLQALRDIVASRNGKSSSWLTDCSSSSDCQAKFLYNLHSTFGGEFQGSISFNDTSIKMAFVSCLLSGDANLGCPYLVHLVTQSLSGNASAVSVFKDVRFLSLVSQSASAVSTGRDALAAANPTDAPSNIPDSICTRNSGAIYKSIFPIVLMVQMVLVASGFVFYATFGNVSCISRLKRDGFLQLMFQNGLSVSAYWSVLWLITVVEMVVFGIVFVLAFGLQCPGYYSGNSLLLGFAAMVLFGIFISSLGYLFSSLIKSYFITLLLMVLVYLVLTVLIVVNRFVLNVGVNNLVARDVLLIFPSGHIAELLVAVLPNQSALTAYTLAILILSCLLPVLVILLNLYLDFLFPSGNGLCLPPSFIFGLLGGKARGGNQGLVPVPEQQTNRPNIEPVEEGVRPMIHVASVDKIYRTRDYPCSTLQITVALNRVSCTIYDGQITALIGHNGAGKTTLLKILTGDENANSGTAVIDGWQVTDPLQRLSLRGRIGICHQGNVLCSDLTVQQCVELVLISRGFSMSQRRAEVTDLLSRLDLKEKFNVKATDLSGGQQRKLCTLLALIGDPRVIFLDEPTSGLDPVSRRRLWQILQEYKTGRAIVLCTQFMDEADILADRKIFLSSGALICAGSSLFLKHAFGCGFVINVSLKAETLAQELLNSLQATCPTIRRKSQFRTEMELSLPASEAAALPEVVRMLENEKSLVDAFGLSQATLDDIFMRLKDVNLGQIEAAFQSGQLSSFAEHRADASREGQAELQQLLSSQTSRATSASAPEQFGALMKMNLTRLKRAKLKLCCRLIFPTILLLALLGALFLERTFSNNLFPLRSNISSFSSFESFGACVQNAEDTPTMTNVTCASMFGSRYAENFAVLKKNESTEISKFLLQAESLDVLNRTCYRSRLCPIAYSSSWNQSKANQDRSIQVGIYQAYRASFVGTFVIGQLLGYYSNVAAFFNSTVPSNTVFSTGLQTYTFSFYPIMGIFIFLTLFSIIPVTYISDPLEDKDSKVRYHLGSMGMSGFGYWVNTFLLHWCQYAVFVILSAVLHAAIVPDKYGNALFLVGIFVPCLLLGCASNQLAVYAIGSLMKKPNPAATVIYFFVVMWLSNAIIGVQFSVEASIVMIWLLPPFATIALVFFGVKVCLYAQSFYSLSSIGDIPDLASIYLSHPFVWHSLIAMAVHIALLVTFIAIMENRSEIAYFCCRALSRRVMQHEMLNRSTDPGVKHEAERINEAPRSLDNVLEVRGLEKKYGNGVMAVRGVTFGSAPGEIFGLLGPNGAGKTTTLSIVVGEEVATGGSCEVRFGDKWMSGSSGATSGAVGYCPQHNPLFGNITVTEHLEFYARIRGVPSDVAARQIPNLVQGLGLAEHRDKQAEQLSGGNKRRLCLAISLLGNPSLVIVDEASTGVDPEAKRFIWSAIRGMANGQRSVVVTTHSMEEVEALCSRVGIMNHGLMIACGTIQQLRSRHGHAYTLDILLSTSAHEEREQVHEKMRRVMDAIPGKFSGSKVIEELFNRVQFLVPQESMDSMSEALAWLTNSQRDLGIQYLTLYQMSLDQVFVRLVKEQEDVKGAQNEAFEQAATEL